MMVGWVKFIVVWFVVFIMMCYYDLGVVVNELKNWKVLLVMSSSIYKL